MSTRAPPPIAPRVLTAAARLVAARGAEGFTMDDLARAAKISRATLYRQARSREAVLDALSAAGADVGDRTDTRGRILAAARVVFCRVGFDGATIEDIAAEAAVGVATVYRHFGDKDGLVATFLDEIGPRRVAREVSASPSGDLRVDLERLAERILTLLRDDEPIVRLMFLEALRGGPLMARVRALSPTRTLTNLAAVIRPHAAAGRLRSTDVQALAQGFGGVLMAFGVVGPVLHGKPLTDPAAVARFVTDLFLHGALAPAPGDSNER